MGQVAMFNEKGVSLIELMLALLILLIVSLALMQTALLGISTNMQNSLRDEAVNVAEMRMNQLRALPFTKDLTHANLVATASTSDGNFSRVFRGFTAQYTSTRTITDLNTDSKQITILVTWNYRSKSYSHGITSIMRKQ